MSFWQLLHTGGVTAYILLMLSVLSLAVIVERSVYYYNCLRVSREDLMGMIRAELKKGAFQKAADICVGADTPSARVIAMGLANRGKSTVEIENAMDRQVTIEMIRMEKRTGIVGTIGSTAVYIGLFGTVLGIIKAFQDIAQKGSGGMGVVINGISEALICTAIGLCVAVPAVIAYNFFIKRVEDLVKDMEVCASEVSDLLRGKE